MIADRPDDTIAAVATAPGRGGVGIVRISGPDAVKISSAVCRFSGDKTLESLAVNTLAFVRIYESGRLIDEGMAAVMRAPRSFTGEDTVELNLHGSPVVLAEVMSILTQRGVRPANPGEFTRPVEGLIRAKTLKAAEMAVNQLKGDLYHKISAFKSDISWVLALLNAGIDFSDEDITFADHQEITQKLTALTEETQRILAGYRQGRMYTDGVRAALFGRPNAGKSSLMNCLLQNERSIVTDIPGTTRDTVSDYFELNGMPVYLTDTAGLRQTLDPVEQEGIRRAYDAVSASDIAVWVIDAAAPFFEEDLSRIPSEVSILPVFNKTDLAPAPAKEKLPADARLFAPVSISCRQPESIDALKIRLTEIFTDSASSGESPVFVTLRQKTCLEEALKYVSQALDIHTGRENEEMTAFLLTESLNALGAVIGETTPDEMLNRIFANFCIGK
ncbi:hypothetical protein CHS0354_018570 [Potamilus streckersoni]|uniref:TrmE-type G domain-containing protein n=1 Tax=Potamilus streckersoni TaxID=2493646 RepID=A0AAE0WAD1_9BIVA|nr:hypothetical protein CHS0354_018570 [Potamilus streckersoni]